MKIFKTSLFAIAVLLCSIANAHDFEVGGIYYYITNATNKTVKVTYKGSSSTEYSNEYTGNVVIPETVVYNGVTYNVKAIGHHAFYECTELTSITIPNSVTSIEYYVFGGCVGLTSIIIPNSVISIGDDAFSDCTGLTSIEISNSIATIENNAFARCKKLKSITIPNSVTTIESGAFASCTGLTNIEIPNSVKDIGNFVFSGCAGLKSITIPNSITAIGDKMFEGCTGLTSIEIPSSVKNIGNYVFDGCTGLSSIKIPNSVTSIGSGILDGCTNLTSITVDAENTSYDSRNNCNAIIETATNTLITGCSNSEIPNSVVSIGDKAFYYRSTLTTINIPNSVTNIGNNVFYGCNSLENLSIGNNVETIGNLAFKGCNKLTNFIIPSSVTKIGYSAFEGCVALTSVTIPSSVVEIGSHAFYGCTALKSLCLEDGSEPISCVILSGVHTEDYFFDDSPIEYMYIGRDLNNFSFKRNKGWQRTLKEVIIGDGMTSIPNSIFDGCYELSSITISDNVSYIGNDAFYSCQGLTNIKLPSGLKSIGITAFCSCTNIKSITIPHNVTSIGRNAFKATLELENLVVEPGNSVYDSRNDCNAIIETETNTLIRGCKNTVIPYSVKNIGSHAFNECAKLESIIIPGSVVSIGDFAFGYCVGLKSITSLAPGNSMPILGTNVFYSVSNCALYVPYGAKSAYKSTAGWSAFTNIVELEKPITDVTISINQYGSGTYCSEYALDFSDVEGLKAYAATGYNVNTGVVTLTRVQTAREGTGLFVKGDPGEYVVPIMESSDDYSLNMLVGTLETTVVNAVSDDGMYRNYKYTIKEGDSAPLFYQFEDNSSLSANRAYLQIPLSWVSSASKSIAVRFDEGEATDIDEIQGETGEESLIYDMQGRVVENPAKGIYIMDGKKVFIR